MTKEHQANHRRKWNLKGSFKVLGIIYDLQKVDNTKDHLIEKYK